MVNRYAIILGAVLSGAFGMDGQPANPLSAELRVSYTYVKTNLIKMAEKMPAENYEFRPTPEVETFGRRVAHITNANTNVCAGLKGESKSAGAAAKTSKAELVAALKEAFAYCDSVFDSLTDAAATEMVSGALGGPVAPVGTTRSKLFTLYNLVRHSNELYGNMSVYLRLKGVVPPTSE
ncbi:MAG TPA: DinB family protein [Bryobacteraceae bacterium]|nr:DinB family protein [Bryobacteraceae bacterium]